MAEAAAAAAVETDPAAADPAAAGPAAAHDAARAPDDDDDDDDDEDPVVTLAAQRAGVDPRVARALLREEYDKIDPEISEILAAVRARGGAECWHKHSSFLSHLVSTWAIAALWGLPREVRLCALLHSAFSNSFVNLALFSPDDDGRAAVRALAGAEVERWTWLFCRVPRNELIYDRLVDPICYGIGAGASGGGSDGQRCCGPAGGEADAGPRPAASEARAAGNGGGGGGGTNDAAAPDYSGRFPSSVSLRDIRDGSDIRLDAYEAGTLVALTILDFSEQWHSWQDAAFATLEDGGGRLRFAGGKRAHHLWPGPGKPGLFLATLSQMGRLVVAANAALALAGDARRIPLPRPWASCSYVVSPEAQLAGRDLYWRVVSELFDAGAVDFADSAKAASQAAGEEREAEAERALRACAELVPCVGEPRVMLAQLLLQRAARLAQRGRAAEAGARFLEAREQAIEGLSLLLAWGTPWDKRFPWGAWCAWARVCAKAAREEAWPLNDEPLRVINMGLVR
jgi:hypothetical protein